MRVCTAYIGQQKDKYFTKLSVTYFRIFRIKGAYEYRDFLITEHPKLSPITILFYNFATTAGAMKN